MRKNEKRNGKALLPIVVFVVLYLGLGILFEYGLDIEMGFYKIPVVVIFLVALLVACIQNRELKLNDKLEVMGIGISDPNIITMIIIFMLSGIFVGIVGRTSANSVAYFILSLVPPQFAVVVLFVVSCFVSLAMGTSVGTITLIVPIGVAVARVSGFAHFSVPRGTLFFAQATISSLVGPYFRSSWFKVPKFLDNYRRNTFVFLKVRFGNIKRFGIF